MVALDGTKLRANASRERNRTSAQLEAEVERMLAEAEQADAYEARLREREQKGARGRQPKRPESDPDTKVNLSDPDSRIVRDYWGHYQDYKAQAVATREQVIVAAELTRAATDVQELQPMVETTNRNLAALGQAPIGILLADAGYYSDANVRSLAEAGPELLIAQSQRPQPARGRRAATRAHPGQTFDPRADAPHADDQAWPSALRAASLDDRTGLRPDQGEPRHPPLPATRFQRLRQRVETNWGQPQSAQALSTPAAPTLARAGRSPLSEASPRSDQPGPTSNYPDPMSKDILQPTTPRRLSTTPTVAKLYATASAKNLRSTERISTLRKGRRRRTGKRRRRNNPGGAATSSRRSSRDHRRRTEQLVPLFGTLANVIDRIPAYSPRGSKRVQGLSRR